MAINLIIVGGGRIGVYLASLMLSGGHKVKIIEQRREQMIRLEKELPREILVLGSGTDPNVLEAAGIYQANVVAAVTGEDETNLVVTNLARFEFNIPRTVAIVNNPKNAWMFTAEMGVDCPLNPADILGHMLAEEMS